MFKLTRDPRSNKNDFKKEEKNHRAVKIIESGLSVNNEAKVASFLTAREKWDALGRIHQGNEDTKRDKITALLTDWENLAMGEKESIEDFHSRFLILVNNLTFLGEILPSWRQVTKVLQCLNSSWNTLPELSWLMVTLKIWTLKISLES